MDNTPVTTPKQNSFTSLLIFSITALVIVFGGLCCSCVFWKNYVSGQFGLFIPFTLLIFVLMNTVFKIPSIIDIILLVVYRHKAAKLGITENRKKTGIILAVVILSVIIAVIVEFMLFLATEGSSLG